LLSRALGIPQKGDFDLPEGITPEEIFYYAYAVFNSPKYRERYEEFLKIDFPRLRLVSSLLGSSESELG
jgi:predicted helicase